MRYVRYHGGMVGKTSVYLGAELTAAWKASGRPLSELVRGGLDALEAGQAGTADIDGARLVLLAALDEYRARHGSHTAADTAHTATPTAVVAAADTAPHTATAPAPAPATRKRQARRAAVDAAPPVAATDPGPEQTDTDTAAPRSTCRHPTQRIDDNSVCRECGTELDPA